MRVRLRVRVKYIPFPLFISILDHLDLELEQKIFKLIFIRIFLSDVAKSKVTDLFFKASTGILSFLIMSNLTYRRVVVPHYDH